MEYRQLGKSGLRVPVLSLGTATFGGSGDFFKAWGTTQVADAKKMVHLCLDAGVNFFDTANVYSKGLSEEILGQAIKGLHDKVLIATKSTFRMGQDTNDFGSSRYSIIKNCEESLERLGVGHIDVYHMHGFDANTPVEETLRALDDLIQSGKVRYIACSNFSGWHLMKSLSVSERHGWARYIANQAHYSLLNREFEWELMPLGLDQGVGTIVWSPLSGGQLSGKIRRDAPAPEGSRFSQLGSHGPEAAPELLFSIVDALQAIAEETGKTIPQVALNWLLQRPTISNIIIGARNEEQLKQNLGAVGWNLNVVQVKKLDAASAVAPVYPYWHQNGNPEMHTAADLYSHL
jgi:aryl-alcohol dehydrogenase-like predicted oxidoreductase